MNRKHLFKKFWRNEEGSFSLEFLVILPFFFLFFLILWQGVVSGYAVISAQSAVNEGAKVYAVTEDVSEASQMAQDIVGNSSIVSVQSFNVTPQDGSGNFEANIEIDHGLVFIPNQWRHTASIPFSHSANSRVIR